MDALRREGKEIQGLMRSLKDASGQYRNFSAGSLPGCEGCHEACKETHANTKALSRTNRQRRDAVWSVCSHRHVHTERDLTT